MSRPTPLRLDFVTGATPDKWARVWRERHRDRALELRPVDEAEQTAGLDDGSADLALVRLPADTADRHCVRLYEEVQVVVAGREHLVAAADRVTLDDLTDEQLVRPHASGWSPSAAQLAWPPMSVKDAVETVAAGTGVALLPQSVARLHRRKDVVVVPVVDLAPTTVALVWDIARDDEWTQELVGITRGRTSRSSRG